MEIKWNKHVVVLYDKMTDGDISSALKYYIEKVFDPCDVVLVDDVSFTNKAINRVNKTLHTFAVKHARGILKMASRHNEQKNLVRIKEEGKTRNVSKQKEAKHKPEIARICNIIKRFDPIILICTTPYALRTAILAKTQLGRDLRVVGAALDFALDPAFVQLSADGYFVENPEIKQKLVHYGVEESRIAVIGMPSLVKEVRPDDARAKAGITNDLPVVVIDGGEYGTATIKADVELLIRNKKDFNLIIVTAVKKMRRYYMELPDFSAGVLIVDRLDEAILDVADILVTLPNSKKIFSAFLRGISVVIAQSVTNHEHEVRRYLVKRALVIPTRTPKETLFAVEELLNDTERELEFKHRGTTYARLSIKDIQNITPRIASQEEPLRIDDTNISSSDE